MIRTQRLTPAANTPMTLAELKLHLRIEVTDTDEDTLITSCLKAGTEWVQNYTRRIIATETWVVALDEFPTDDNQRIFLPFGKLQSITNIIYADSESTTVTLTGPSSGVPGTDYQESLINETVPYLLPAYGESWPTATRVIDPVKITLVAGYGDTADSPEPVFPEDLLAAIRVRAADYYERRASDDVQNIQLEAAKALCAPYVLPAVVSW